MRLIQPNDLVPNTTYYIQWNHAPAGYAGYSGKKMGEFVRLGMFNNVPPVYAYFSNLRDIPNARLRSGMGTMKNNHYSILNNSFFLPENEMILSNATARRGILDQRSRFSTNLEEKLGLDPDTSNKIATDYFPVGLGTRRKRAHKSKRRRRNNKK